MALTALFIGGNGTISSAVSALAVERGIDLTVLNRGVSAALPGVRHLVGDAGDAVSMAAAVGDREFDVVVNFRSFLPQQARDDVELFAGRTGQYVYISSASAYQKPVTRLPITESTPLKNPYWQYSRDKIASEEVLTAAWRESDFPVTIVRPSHTYDRKSIPLLGGWTAIDRMRRGKPVVVHGDGTSLWVLTHHLDFAGAFVGLLGNPAAVGDAFQVTSDEVLTWDEITRILGTAAGVEPEIVHVTSAEFGRALPDWEPWLSGDRTHSVIFDNAKIKSAVPGWRATIPFWQGARELLEWHDADASRQVVDPALDATFDALVAAAR